MSLCLAIGTMALQGYSTLKAGSEEKKAYDQYAAEKRLEAGETQRRTKFKLEESAREEKRAVGKVKSAAAGAGLRVAGSVNRLELAVSEQFARERNEMGIQTAFETGQMEREALRLKERGRQKKKASEIGTVTGGLGNLYKLGTQQKWWEGLADMGA